MSKLCDRNYSENGMFTAKIINGEPCCPSCSQPTIVHGKSIEWRALRWALSGDTGSSSETLCNFMLGFKAKRATPPSDASDRGRCIRLLQLIPEWIDELPELARADKPREELVISGSGMRAEVNSWAKQIPLIIAEGNL